MYPHSHKTVFVLDKHPFFKQPSNESIEIDIFTKSRNNIPPLPPVMKSMWTCNIEAVIEYCRIVFDIHTCEKLIRIIVSNTDAYDVNGWSTKDQNISKLMQSLAMKESHATNKAYSSKYCEPGLKLAVNALSEATEFQRSLSSENILNNGRIIVLTTLNSDEDMQQIHSIIKSKILAVSEQISQNDNEKDKNYLPIDNIDLVVLNIAPTGTYNIYKSPQKNIDPYLNSICLDAFSGIHICNRLVEICMYQFDLASTIVTGIPMKEEQNASSSANYDVELLHHRNAHFESRIPVQSILKDDDTEVDSDDTEDKTSVHEDTKTDEDSSTNVRCYGDVKFQSATLKWCTPRGNAIESLSCIGAFRISPVDVNSRPSSCLTNFLLNGRSVMLEQQSISKHGSKVISHALISHGGEIYIHALAVKRMQLEESPSISEGHGGRVTDYRINDFAELMIYNLMAPSSVVQDGVNEVKDSIIRAKEQLERNTRVWPLVLSETILFNVNEVISKLLSVITHEKITESEFREGQQAIYNVVAMESRKESLPLRNNVTSAKREEQYVLFWNELERLLRCFKGQSSKHLNLHQCVEDCKRTANDNDDTSGMFDNSNSSDIKSETAIEISSDEQPSPEKKMKYLIDRHNVKKGNNSLMNIYNKTIRNSIPFREDFQGRLDSKNNIAKLYIDLEADRFNAIKDPRTKEIGNTLNNKISQIRNGYKKTMNNSNNK